jgi:hypothetical protein
MACFCRGQGDMLKKIFPHPMVIGNHRRNRAPERGPAAQADRANRRANRAHAQLLPPSWVTRRGAALPRARLPASRSILARSSSRRRSAPTYFGKHRAIFVCNSCRAGAIRLFSKDGNYACRFCHRAQYLSQKQKTASRKRLAACKLRLELGGAPS